jgi:hypothetical protein
MIKKVFKSMAITSAAITGLMTFYFLGVLFQGHLSADGYNQEHYPVIKDASGEILNIINPGFPQTPAATYLLKEELSIGNGDDENYIFSGRGAIDVDNEGNIYLLDGRNRRVQIFDKQGRFIRTIGRRGSGPGEWMAPMDMAVDTKNKKIYVLDSINKKITRYCVDGKLEHEKRILLSTPVQLFLLPENHYIIRFYNYDESGYPQDQLIKYTSAGDMAMRFDPSRFSHKKLETTRNVTTLKMTPFDPHTHFAVDYRGNIYSGYSSRYKISVFDSLGKQTLAIEKKDPQLVEVSKKEKKKFLDRLKSRFKRKGLHLDTDSFNIPRYQPVFLGIWLDDGGNIWVQVPGNDNRVYFDVFSSGGVYRNRFIFQGTSNHIEAEEVFNNALFYGNCIYSIVNDEEEGISIKRYRMMPCVPRTSREEP